MTIDRRHRRSRTLAWAGALAFTALAAAPALAQGNRSSDYSLIPYTQRGYAGLSLGRTEFDLGCGLGNFSCDKHTNLAVRAYTGGMFNDWLGLEVGYINTGKADRAGGSTDAQGVDLMLVGRVPMGQFNVFAKAGGVYGRTKVSSSALSGIRSGNKSGAGEAGGVGVGYDFDRSNGVVLEWTRYKFRFANEGHPNTDVTHLGYVHRF